MVVVVVVVVVVVGGYGGGGPGVAGPAVLTSISRRAPIGAGEWGGRGRPAGA